FQAEDGIRDKLVTGVQTCALPISALARIHAIYSASDTALDTPLLAGSRVRSRPSLHRVVRQTTSTAPPSFVAVVCTALRQSVPRSEERRVGKECRSGWRAEH